MFSVSSYAKHRGCYVRAVQYAIERGRLRESVVFDSEGKPKITDFHTADAEWARNTVPTHGGRRAGAGRKPGSKTKAKAASKDGPPAADDQHEDGEADQAEDRTPKKRGPKPAGYEHENGKIVTAADATAAEKYWKAQTAELDFKAKAGELVNAKQVETEIAGMIASARQKLLAIPSKAKSALPHLTLADVETLERLLRDALEGLADGRQ